ncbi:MAG TPA: nuclear transport factor 2 family protein [Bacteroidales bacterium]|nr:nuclear transport factor 2 family protein [Bacteroidales bacterium]
MKEIKFPKGEEAWNEEQVDALLRIVEDIFHRKDIDALINGFTEDCTFKFAEQPEQHGRKALRRLFEARMARQNNYRLKKENLALQGNQLANAWIGTWEDSVTGKKMEGHGVEVWVMRDGMIAEWDAAFNVWEAGGERRSAVM